MGFTRLFSSDDGESHIEELDLAGLSSATPPTLKASSIAFRTYEPGHLIDWHTGPRRQFVITLSGRAEIGLSDGTVHLFEPGHVSLVEDLTGKGHTTKVVGDEPRVIAIIPVD